MLLYALECSYNYKLYYNCLSVIDIVHESFLLIEGNGDTVKLLPSVMWEYLSEVYLVNTKCTS